MSRFLFLVVVPAALVASAGASEYRFDVAASGISFEGRDWAAIPVDSSRMFPPDSTGPTGIQVVYPDPAGTDSVSWRNPRAGLAGRSCLGCKDLPGWIGTAFTSSSLALQTDMMTDSMALADARIDTQQVLVDGVVRTYVRTQTGYCCAFSMSGTALVGIGTVYYQESYNASLMSNYGKYLRMLDYDGVNVDSLWTNGTLTRPVAIRPSTHRAQARFAPRRFDLHEMGIFLGRKSALREPLSKAP